MPDADNVVLVADDEEKILQSVSRTLEKAGFTVVAVRGSEAVAELCARGHQSIRLAIIDLAIASQGPGLLDRIQECFPGIRILFTSNRDDADAARQLGRAGQIREFLKKPFRRSQLLGRVLKALDAPLTYTA